MFLIFMPGLIASWKLLVMQINQYAIKLIFQIYFFPSVETKWSHSIISDKHLLRVYPESCCYKYMTLTCDCKPNSSSYIFRKVIWFIHKVFNTGFQYSILLMEHYVKMSQHQNVSVPKPKRLAAKTNRCQTVSAKTSWRQIVSAPKRRRQYASAK